MILPRQLNDKITALASELKSSTLKQTRANLTDKYKNHTGQSTDLISGKNDSILYAISRMPATYSVIYSLIFELASEGVLEKLNTVCDIGSGTGSAYFALSELYDDIKFSLYERSQAMIDIFKRLSDNAIDVNKSDAVKTDFETKYDLVMTSFVLSEMTEQDRNKVFEKMLDISDKYVLVIDTGTPETYKNIYKLKAIAKEKGYNVIAPCKCERCTLENDYCQFYARVERSSLLRQSKSASLPYEDEKYFYLLFEKVSNANDYHNANSGASSTEYGRVIRRPKIKEKEVELILCTPNGTDSKRITKANKQLFKNAKKIKINQILSENDSNSDWK